MILAIETDAGTSNINVQIKNTFTANYTQNTDYVTSINGKTQTYENGPTFDKWSTSITIQGLKDDIFTLITTLEKFINQITITCETDELIFGAGIDYSNPIVCNVTNNDIPYPRVNQALAEITLSLDALSTNGAQLSYKASVPTVLPSLNYQKPVNRVLERDNTPFQSSEFGDYGNSVVIGTSVDPAKKYEFPLVFSQNETDTASLEKIYSLQRSTPFLWTGLDCLELFADVGTENVMIKSLSTTHLEIDNWRVNLTIITNV